MLPLDLEDWLTEVGNQIVEKMASGGEAALTEKEKLIHEIWLLDTEARNGGLSQYFANWGLKQWERCHALATTWPGTEFLAFR
jgi:hypothetical protein